MRKDLPPVKEVPSGKQARGKVRLPGGTYDVIYISDEVAGEYHFFVPAKEFRMTKEELIDMIQLIEGE